MVDEPLPDDRPPPGRWTRILGVGLALVVTLRALVRGPAHAAPAVHQEGDGQPPGELLHPDVRREVSDASFRAILWILGAAMALSALILFVVLRFFYDYSKYQAEIKRSHYPLAVAESSSLPPEPRLEQVSRMAGIEKGNVYLREERKESILESYGPLGDGYVRIPIDRAMDLLANKLPVRSGQPSAEQARRLNGLVDAGEPNSGRMFRGTQHD